MAQSTCCYPTRKGQWQILRRKQPVIRFGQSNPNRLHPALMMTSFTVPILRLGHQKFNSKSASAVMRLSLGGADRNFPESRSVLINTQLQLGEG